METRELRHAIQLQRRGFSLRAIARKMGRSHECVRQNLILANRSERRLGRPPKYGERMLAFRFSLPPALLRALETEARSKQLSRNDVLVGVLTRWAKRNRRV